MFYGWRDFVRFRFVRRSLHKYNDVPSFYKVTQYPFRALQLLEDYVKLIGADTFLSDDSFVLESVLDGK